jgi:hypothetical protein
MGELRRFKAHATIASLLRALAGSLFQKFGFFMDCLRISKRKGSWYADCTVYCVYITYLLQINFFLVFFSDLQTCQNHYNVSQP